MNNKINWKSTKLWGFILIMILAIIDGIFEIDISSHAWFGIVGAYAIFAGSKAWQNITAMKNGAKK